ncbi:MAG: SIS domain-containing protein, partial [Bacillota bacterium]|nr:SIS domain-containing protein [Bacillota bacterium]
ITLSIRQKLMSGNSVYAFGNGGSSAIASYFVDELREIYKGSLKAYSRVHDITSLKGLINSCIHHGSYKSDVFTKILDRFGINEGDVLLGVSSSGNSENVVHPFKNFPKSVRIGILGLQDGGRIGKSNMKDIAFIMPDSGGFRSYQRAEDGQRIALSSILHALKRSENKI